MSLYGQLILLSPLCSLLIILQVPSAKYEASSGLFEGDSLGTSGTNCLFVLAHLRQCLSKDTPFNLEVVFIKEAFESSSFR